MSVETIAILTLLVTIIVGGFAGFGWVVHRMDATADKVRSELKTGLGDLRSEFRTDINDLRKDVGEIRSELTEVKIAIARIEGPPRRLVPAR